MAMLPGNIHLTGLSGGDLGFSVAFGSGAAFSFSTSRGDALNPEVGDSWEVHLSAIRSFQLVTKLETSPDGKTASTIMGRTDEAGNFVAIGQFSVSDLGSWSQVWTVGGVTVGTWNFTVRMPSGVARQLAPATLLTPLPSIINPRPDEVSSADLSAGCQVSSWVSQNPLFAVLTAIGIGWLLRRM